MDVPLLATKLYTPRVRANLVARSRLLERLDEGRREGCRLVLVSAPAGFGKTMLLADWVHRPVSQESPAECLETGETPWLPSLPPAWISLDADDNDPARFLTYVIAAMDSVHPDVGCEALELLQSSQPPPCQAALVTLINSLAGLTTEFVLVLDDYHVIETRAIHDMLSFVLEHMPPCMHMVIAGRSDPPLQLAGLRARGQLVELRAADLRFTPDEAATFLTQAMGLALTTEQVSSLEKRTEGWIAGLQLAALSMQGRKDVSGFISAFTGAQHFILDYLMEEVLQRQNEEVKTFLLQTSILERLAGPLCDALIDGASARDSQSLLESLDRANLFLVPLDDQQEWYRYHHLFAEFLRARLQRTFPERIAGLHLRASRWFEGNGLVSEAIDHALAGGDWERAVDLIESIARPIFLRGEVVKPMAWLEALPGDVVRARPRLCLLHAWGALFSCFQPQTAEARLRDAETSLAANTTFSDEERADIELEVTAVRGFASLFLGDSHRPADAFPPATRDQSVSSALALNRGFSHIFSGDSTAAIGVLAEAAVIAQQAGNILVAITAMCQTAEQLMYQGRLRQAGEAYRQALSLATENGQRSLTLAGMVHVGIGELLREQNALDEATQHLMTGMKILDPWGEIVALDGYVCLARVKQAQGDAPAALELIENAVRLAHGSQMSMDDSLVESYRARLWAMQGRLAEAADWVRAHASSLEDTQSAVPYILRELQLLALARVRIFLAQPEAALPVLQRLLPIAEKLGRTGVVIEILALQAVALDMLGDTPGALALLERALILAEPEGYVRLFLDLGERMPALLRAVWVRAGTPELVGAYARRLVREAEAAPGTASTRQEGSRMPPERPHVASAVAHSELLIEPLTEREMEVLAMMATGKTNQEIAADLVIAISTVRSHVKSIYGKLGVSNRVQAVLNGREYGLLT